MMNEAFNGESERDMINREMPAVVERTRPGLTLVMTFMKLAQEYDLWADVLNWNRDLLNRATAKGDSDQVTRAEQLLEGAEQSVRHSPEILAFLQKVSEGHLPEDWTVKPEGWVYSYEGTYRHYVIRDANTVKALESDLGRSLTDLELRALALADSERLAKLVLGKELDPKEIDNMILSGDPRLAEVVGAAD